MVRSRTVSNRLAVRDDATTIGTKEEAPAHASEAPTNADCKSVVAPMPYRTRSTWIVPGTSNDSTWRVDIDPLTAKTRLVGTAG
uniref:Uncharacterized protein n=1 Tax=Natrinema halophilum TaxID=1699371 RepID=A0A7D5GW48_9EURY